MKKLNLEELKNEKSQAALILTDPNSGKAVNELKDVQKRLDSLQNALEKGVEMFDNTKTNELLQKALDEVVELHKSGKDDAKALAIDVLEQIGKIKHDIKVPTPIANVSNKIVVDDWRKKYMFSDSDKTESMTYVGFVDPDGNWFIERVTKSANSDKARFVFGKGDYVNNWSGRLRLNYNYLFEAING